MGDLIRELEDQKAALDEQTAAMEKKMEEMKRMEFTMKEEQMRMEKKQLTVRRDPSWFVLSVQRRFLHFNFNKNCTKYNNLNRISIPLR